MYSVGHARAAHISRPLASKLGPPAPSPTLKNQSIAQFEVCKYYNIFYGESAGHVRVGETDAYGDCGRTDATLDFDNSVESDRPRRAEYKRGIDTSKNVAEMFIGPLCNITYCV